MNFNQVKELIDRQLDNHKLVVNQAPSPKSMGAIRRQRNKLLDASDWTQVSDNGLSAEKRAEWATYRQSLRDITIQDINSISWPSKPA
jgi:hypothetical protein